MGINDFFDGGEGAVGEAKANTVVAVIMEFVEVWDLILELGDDTADEGVLAKDDFGFAIEVVTDMEKLGGSNVLSRNKHNLVVAVEEFAEFGAEI